MMYRSRLLEKSFSSGTESLDVGLYNEADIPWELLAFPAIRETLKYYYQDRQVGQFRIRSGEIRREDQGYMFLLHT